MVITQMAIHTNAPLAGIFFTAAPIGTLVPGAHADIILVDYQPNTSLTADNLPWHIIFGVQPGMITTTIVGG
jgi:cytosine/adenosine deaminase-related metal-dependent hydrolase